MAYITFRQKLNVSLERQQICQITKSERSKSEQSTINNLIQWRIWEKPYFQILWMKNPAKSSGQWTNSRIRGIRCIYLNYYYLPFLYFAYQNLKWSFTFHLLQWHSHHSQSICTHNTNACQEFCMLKNNWKKNISLSTHYVVCRLFWMRLARVVEQTRNLVFKYWIALVSLHTIASVLFPFPFHSLNIRFFHCCVIFFVLFHISIIVLCVLGSWNCLPSTEHLIMIFALFVLERNERTNERQIACGCRLFVFLLIEIGCEMRQPYLRLDRWCPSANHSLSFATTYNNERLTFYYLVMKLHF